MDLKEVHYRGGVVRFRIPATWKEEYEEQGGGTFYDEGKSATLRLNVTTMRSERDFDDDEAVKVVDRDSGDGREIRKLENGNALAKYVRDEVDRGVSLKIHYWELAGPLPPRHMRIALFSYTIRADEAADPVTFSEIELLDPCIAEAELSENLGVTVEASKKPWWKIW